MSNLFSEKKFFEITKDCPWDQWDLQEFQALFDAKERFEKEGTHDSKREYIMSFELAFTTAKHAMHRRLFDEDILEEIRDLMSIGESDLKEMYHVEY